MVSLGSVSVKQSFNRGDKGLGPTVRGGPERLTASGAVRGSRSSLGSKMQSRSG